MCCSGLEHAKKRLARLALVTPLLLPPPLLLLRLGWSAAAVTLWRDFSEGPGGAAFNPIVGRAFQLAWRYAWLLCAGALLARLSG